MAVTGTKKAPTRARHQLTGEDYPGEWARQIEVYLDKDHRRAAFYGGLFGTFVLAVVIAVLTDVAL